MTLFQRADKSLEYIVGILRTETAFHFHYSITLPLSKGNGHRPHLSVAINFERHVFAGAARHQDVIQKMIAVNNSAILTPFENTAEKIGTLLITDHLLVFEMSSVVLLGALIGAAIIARPKKDI